MINKNAYVRIEKWVAKYSGERQGVSSLLSKTKATMQIKQLFAQQWEDEGATKLILGEAGTPRWSNPFYLNFGREVRGLRNQNLTGNQLLAAVNISLNKWTARGLDSDILEKIRNTCFTIAPPAP
jgi:hypothetical protein